MESPLSLFNHPFFFQSWDFLEGKRRHRGIISVGFGSFFFPRTDDVGKILQVAQIQRIVIVLIITYPGILKGQHF